MTPCAPHSSAMSMSCFSARAKVKIRDFSPSLEISLIASASCGDTAGIPASIRSTPTSSSLVAMRILSSIEKTTPGVCSPSRKVASWIWTFGGNSRPCAHFGDEIVGADPPLAVFEVILAHANSSRSGPVLVPSIFLTYFARQQQKTDIFGAVRSHAPRARAEGQRPPSGPGRSRGAFPGFETG